MRIEFTVRHAGETCDVAVTAPAPVALAALEPELARVAGVPRGQSLWSGDRPLAATAALGGAGLRTGAVLSYGGPHRAAPAPGVLALHQVGGPDAGRVAPLARARLVIGRGTECDLVLADADASRRHAVIEVSSTAITLFDAGSTNGTYVDGQPIAAEGHALLPGQVIRIGDCSLTVAGPTQTPAALSPAADGTVRVLRPPRHAPAVADTEIEIPVRPTAARPRGLQWITALLPAGAGAAIAWMTHSPQFLLFALLSPVMMLSSSLGDRLHWRRSRRRDAATFVRRRADADRQIAAALRNETVARRALAPDPAAVVRLVSLPGSHLWERRRTDPDLLRLCVGMADLPSAAQVREGSAVRAAGTVRAVPLDAGLRDGPLGLAGPRDVVTGLARWLVGQLAALHSPTDVGISLLLGSDAVHDWQWARWLPHLGGRAATCAQDWYTHIAELTNMVDRRLAARRLDPDGWSGPWHVLVLDRASQLADVPGLGGLLGRGRTVGLTAVCIDDDAAALPTACRSVAQVSGETGSRAHVRDGLGGEHAEVVVDAVSHAWADTVARHLAPLVDAGEDGSARLPDSYRLFEALDVDTGHDLDGSDAIDERGICRRWESAGDGAATVAGWSADGPQVVDLVADGPHALIAGTTGAGKSELLQTLVAGLAANHPPDDVNFLLIDYKGGAAFAECARLPHTAGLVTDLDPYLTIRALRSLTSELRRRERLFADCGVADLGAYRAAAAVEPLARLIIVVDEFATLAEELPDFVRGLVGAAQRGRSLGVHLVLATQRPGSAVSPEIRANTSLRIALRVTEPAESSDVVDSPDAATIEGDRPGRAYLRTGSTLTCFQAAHAGAARPAAVDAVVEPLDAWRRPVACAQVRAGPSELRLLVAALGRAAAASGRPSARTPWLPPLPDQLPRRSLYRPGHAGSVTVGHVDLPDSQRQAGVEIDLTSGSSLLAAGSARSGRTGLLSSVVLGAAEGLGPDRLSVYVIDAAGVLAGVLAELPHCITIIGPDDLANAPVLLRRLDRLCAAVAQPGNRAVGRQPMSLLVVDGWESLLASLADVDTIECAASLAGLLRAGPAAALSMVVTGDRSALAPRLAAGFGARFLLRLTDRNDYGMAGISPCDVPSSMPPGRALRAEDAALVQIAHAGDAPGHESATREVARLARLWSGCERAASSPGVRLRALPRSVSLGELTRHSGRVVLGLGGDEAEPVHIDLFAGAGRVLIAGPPRSGRSTVLCSLLAQALDAALAAVVAASPRSPLARLAAQRGVRVIGPDDRADTVGCVPSERTLLLVDDCEAFVDAPSGEALALWVRSDRAPLAAVVAGRNDDLATTYRGVGAQVRRSNCGLLLRPGPVDGEILGVRLPRRPSAGPAGRGVLVGDPAWGAQFAGEPIPIQVAAP